MAVCISAMGTLVEFLFFNKERTKLDVRERNWHHHMRQDEEKEEKNTVKTQKPFWSSQNTKYITLHITDVRPSSLDFLPEKTKTMYETAKNSLMLR